MKDGEIEKGFRVWEDVGVLTSSRDVVSRTGKGLICV